MNAPRAIEAGAALSLAAAGLPVFPCRADKAPLTRGGFKDATADPERVAAWWRRWPDALAGVPTGAASGLFVIDADVDRETGEAIGEAALAPFGLTPASHRYAARTRSGGAHFAFGWSEDLPRNTAGRLPGVDTRGDGGYVIAWAPDMLAALKADPTPPRVPAALLAALTAKERKAEAKGADLSALTETAKPAEAADAWAAAALAAEVARVRTAAAGGRNDALNRAAFALGSIAAGGALEAARVEAELFAAALAAGLGEAEARKTIRSGMDAGARDPRTRSDRAGHAAQASAGETRTPEPPQRASRFFCASTLAGRPIEPRPWHVPDLIPGRTVTLLGGDGGTGKSLLALQLAVATATGRAWIGRETAQGGALFLSAEDDADELHRRLADVLTAEGLDFEDLDRLTLRSLAGEDALLAAPDKATGALRTTALHDELDARLRDEAPALLILDTAADLHAGNENDRAQVRQFVGILRGLAIRNGCAVVLLAHPSLTGMASGSGLSGSTAWNGSVRSRLYLERITEEGYEPNPDARRLTTKKANYARTGIEIGLTWRAGVFVADAPEQPAGRLDRMAASAKAERVFLKLLRQFSDQGRYVSAQPGPTYAPAIFAKADAEGCTKRAFVGAMESLFAGGKLIVAQHGKGAKARSHIAENDGCDR